MSDVTNRQKNNAGRHLVVGEAMLQGYPAKLLDTGAYVQINGRSARVQVATQGAWMIQDVDAYAASLDETIVLVEVTDRTRRFYVAPGDQLRSEVSQRHSDYMQRVGQRPRNPDSRHTAIRPEEVQHWRDRWDVFGSPRGIEAPPIG